MLKKYFRRADRILFWILPSLSFLYFIRHYHPMTYCLAGMAILVAGGILMAGWDGYQKIHLGLMTLVVVGIALPALGVWQFLSLGDPGDVDHAAYACAFWNLEHGRTYYAIANQNIFGIHANYTCLFWLPLHYLAGELGIKIGKCLCLLITVGLVAKRFWGKREMAAWAALAVLLSPPIASQFFFGFHPEFLAPPVLILAMEAYRNEKLGRFLAYAAFLAFTKEVYTMAIGGILLVALAERRSWKWLLLPGLLGCAQMALYWFFIIPHFSPDGNHFRGLLPGSSEAIFSLLFRRNTLAFALHLVLPFLPLMLVLPKRYLLLPLPLFLFYSVMPDWTHDMWRHYPHPFALLCFGGLILMKEAQPEGKVAQPGGKAPSKKLAVDGRILIACTMISLLSFPLWRTVFSLPNGGLARATEVARIRKQVPETASVLVNGSFTAWFAARKDIMDWTYKVMPLGHFDYVVIDETFHPDWLDKRKELGEDIAALSNSSDWARLYGHDGLYLFRHSPQPTAPLTP